MPSYHDNMDMDSQHKDRTVSWLSYLYDGNSYTWKDGLYISSLYWNGAINIDGLVQDCSNSIANAQELLQSCTEPSIRSRTWLLRGWGGDIFNMVVAVVAGAAAEDEIAIVVHLLGRRAFSDLADAHRTVALLDLVAPATTLLPLEAQRAVAPQTIAVLLRFQPVARLAAITVLLLGARVADALGRVIVVADFGADHRCHRTCENTTCVGTLKNTWALIKHKDCLSQVWGFPG